MYGLFHDQGMTYPDGGKDTGEFKDDELVP